jgi:hypothetical protein
MENPALILYQLSKLIDHKIKHESRPEAAAQIDALELETAEPCEEWPEVIGAE